MFSLRAELQLLQAKLNENQSQSQQDSSRLKEARKTQRKLEEKNATLTSQLSAAQVAIVDHSKAVRGFVPYFPLHGILLCFS